MKQLNRLFISAALTKARGAFLTGLAVVAVVALAASAVLNRVQAAGGPHPQDEDGGPLSQIAQIDQLLADYHGALAYGGNIDAMAKLWAEDSSLTLNGGTPYVGKAAVLAFYAAGPYFQHNWVSLAPEWKTTVTVHGHTAEATTECVATDVSVTPNVIRGVIQLNATCEKREGKWLFTKQVNFTQPEI